jgi:hypothetical protein
MVFYKAGTTVGKLRLSPKRIADLDKKPEPKRPFKPGTTRKYGGYHGK